MAFQLQVSNSLEKLSEKLSADIQSVPKEVFQPVYIVTQTEGMNSWLKLQIAGKTGIAANLQFLKPNDLISKIFNSLGGLYSQTLSAQNLNWLLYKLLGEKEFVSKYNEISSYYHYDGIDKDVKRMALAEKIADLFDQYQVYRTDMIEEWNNPNVLDSGGGRVRRGSRSSRGGDKQLSLNFDILSYKPGDDNWQKYLWQHAKQIAGNNFPDRTLIGKSIHDALQNPDQVKRLKQKLPVVYFFGISLITEYHLQIFQNLANHIDINFLFLNPAPSIYWFDDKSEKQVAFLKRKGMIGITETNMGNPLLTNWGKIIRDTFSLLFKNDEIINGYEELEVKEPAPDNLLRKIQYSVFHNENLNAEDRLAGTEIQDGSITINSCYSPAREVEVLYNYLVHLIDKKNEPLSSRDIIVMVSDIDLYASYIKAIFDNAPDRFKYTIADESYASSDSISNALHAVLSVTEQNFTAEVVVSLLDFSFIRERFGITDIPLVRNVVNEANIRFGAEGNLTDESFYVSWKYGLKRIMYGICMSSADEYGNGEESFYPLDIVEGSTSHEVIRFVHFAEILMDALEERKEAKTIAGWVEYVDTVLHNFVCDKEEITDEDYGILLSQLEDYNSFSELFTEEISYEVFIHSFSSILSGTTRSKSFAGGGITFCSLIPMRSIPFKVVALLGMNFDKFPRKENNLSFNLMEKERRMGDRNVKENDKHLFLETILSAENYLYISYIGQSVKDNSAIPPSVLVDELVDHISSGAAEPSKVPEQLITLQPLHGFSQKYTAGDTRLYSYLRVIKPAIENLQKEKSSEPRDFDEVSLDRMIGFLKNPVRGFYNRVLGIYYNNDDTTLRDTELFELDSLQKWRLKNQLLITMSDEQKHRLKNKLVKTGDLPLKNIADVEFQNVEAEVIPVRELFGELIGNAEAQKLYVDITLGSSLLKGVIRGVYDNKLVVVSWSKSETKYLLEAYIRYLALRASGNEAKLYFISLIKGEVFPGTEISGKEAYGKLKELLQLYKQGHENILAFASDFDIRPADIKNLDASRFQNALNDKFEKYGYPCTDTYMNKQYANGFFHTNNIVKDYKAVAEKLLVPLAGLFPDYYQ
jgi:exodeoxyribonuclease V gamma subunit